jgi:hypothetical protein
MGLVAIARPTVQPISVVYQALAVMGWVRTALQAVGVVGRVAVDRAVAVAVAVAAVVGAVVEDVAGAKA